MNAFKSGHAVLHDLCYITNLSRSVAPMRVMRVFEALAEVSMGTPLSASNVVNIINSILEKHGYQVKGLATRTLVGEPAYAQRPLMYGRKGPSSTHTLQVSLRRPRFPLLEHAEGVFYFNKAIAASHVDKLTRFLSYAITEALVADRASIGKHITDCLLRYPASQLWRKVLDLRAIEIGQIYDLDVILYDPESDSFHSTSNRRIDPTSLVADGIRSSFAAGRVATYYRSGIHVFRKNGWKSVGDARATSRPFLILPLVEPIALEKELERDDSVGFLVARSGRFSHTFEGSTWEELALLDYVSREVSVVYNFIRTQQQQQNDFEAITHGLISNANKLIAISKDIDESLDDLWKVGIRLASRYVADQQQRLQVQSTLSEATRPLQLQSRDLYLFASDIKNQMLIAENIESSLSLADLSQKVTRSFLADILQVLQNLREVIARRYSRGSVRFNNFKQAGFGEMPAVQGDKSLILLVFRNLLDNSVKYNDASTSTIKVDMRWHDMGDSVCIEYRDNGMGIQRSELGKLFRARYRSQRAVRRGGAAGRGLGLYHCATVLSAIGGSIEAHPIRHGSLFVIMLRKAKRR